MWVLTEIQMYHLAVVFFVDVFSLKVDQHVCVFTLKEDPSHQPKLTIKFYFGVYLSTWQSLFGISWWLKHQDFLLSQWYLDLNYSKVLRYMIYDIYVYIFSIAS